MATMSGGWWIDRPPSRHPDADAVHLHDFSRLPDRQRRLIAWAINRGETGVTALSLAGRYDSVREKEKGERHEHAAAP